MNQDFSGTQNPSTIVPTDRDKAVKQLNELLRGELSACETYRQALDKLSDYGQRAKLQDCLVSHEQRVAKVRQHITQIGCTPDTDSGPWGAFAKLVEGGAKIFGEGAAIGALEEGEDYGLKQYREAGELDQAVRDVVQRELLPAQIKTHATMSSLKKSLN